MKPSLRIAMLCESFAALGGVAQIVEDLAREFISAGHQVAIVSNPPQGAIFTRASSAAVRQVWLNLPRTRPAGWRHPERWLRHADPGELITFIEDWRPHVLNVHGGLRDRFPAVVAAARNHVPLILSFHLPAAFPPDADAERVAGLTRAALNAAEAITFQSDAVKDAFKSFSPEANRGRVIRGGVNFEAAAAARPCQRARQYVLSVSRLDLSHKAIDELIAGFGLIAAQFPEVDLLIVGDGPARERLAKIIDASGFSSRIELLPAQPHEALWSFYKGALLFAMPSRKPEGLGLAFLEAMACGIPVIGTRSGGTPEVVLHGLTGLLVERNEPDELAAAMQHLLQSAELRQQMGQRACEVAKKFNWREVAPQYLDIYQTLLARSGSITPAI